MGEKKHTGFSVILKRKDRFLQVGVVPPLLFFFGKLKLKLQEKNMTYYAED